MDGCNADDVPARKAIVETDLCLLQFAFRWFGGRCVLHGGGGRHLVVRSGRVDSYFRLEGRFLSTGNRKNE